MIKKFFLFIISSMAENKFGLWPKFERLAMKNNSKKILYEKSPHGLQLKYHVQYPYLLYL